jgi:hypothetical protein
MENNCCCDKNSNSGFIFGLVLGAVIGAIIAIIIYKNNKTEVFENLSEKLKTFFEKFTGQEPKSEPETQKPSPKKIIASIPSKPKKPAPKMFVKPKR